MPAWGEAPLFKEAEELSLNRFFFYYLPPLFFYCKCEQPHLISTRILSWACAREHTRNSPRACHLFRSCRGRASHETTAPEQDCRIVKKKCANRQYLGKYSQRSSTYLIKSIGYIFRRKYFKEL